MNPDRIDEELLREFACNGDLTQIQTLLTNKPSLNLDSQNAMNGWTALHWAVKRNHPSIVRYLLENGAKKDIPSHDQLIPAQICTNDTLRQILDASVISSSSICSTTLPIVPNYLRHPVFPYMSSQVTSSASAVEESKTINLFCRIANDPTETDFVEFDFDKMPTIGSFERLRGMIIQELEIDRIAKLRRLPCIRVRNDRDVARLEKNQLLEVIRMKPDDESFS